MPNSGYCEMVEAGKTVSDYFLGVPDAVFCPRAQDGTCPYGNDIRVDVDGHQIGLCVKFGKPTETGRIDLAALLQSQNPTVIQSQPSI